MRLSERLLIIAKHQPVTLGAKLALRQAANAIESTEPRPWPPPAGVERCLGWDAIDERWRACVLEHGDWRFEAMVTSLRHCVTLWLPMPADPQEAQ